MKIPYVIPDSIRNPDVKEWIPASAGMTMYFHINPDARVRHNEACKSPPSSPMDGEGIMPLHPDVSTVMGEE